jgi:hypothetical protein
MNVSFSLCHLFFVVEKWKIWGFSRRFEFVAFLSYFKKHTEQKDINYFCLSSVLLFQFSVFRRQTEKKRKKYLFSISELRRKTIIWHLDTAAKNSTHKWRRTRSACDMNWNDFHMFQFSASMFHSMKSATFFSHSQGTNSWMIWVAWIGSKDIYQILSQ